MTSTASAARQSSALSMSTAAPDATTTASSSSLVGIDNIRTAVLEVLNEIFDPADIARGAAIAKLDGKKKKKKKKKKPQGEEQPAAIEEEEPKMSEEERASIIEAAVAAAQPFTSQDTMVTPATKNEFGDYQCNAALSLAKSAGLNPRECAQRIVDVLEPKLANVVETPLEIAGPGFINLKFRDDYLSDALGKMAGDSAERLAVPLSE